MSPETILVVGGTGMLRRRVARRLLQDGYGVRLLTRDADRARASLGPGFGYLAGDVDDDAAVGRALEGCAGVHVSLSGGSTPRSSTASSTGGRRASPSSPRGKACPV